MSARDDSDDEDDTRERVPSVSRIGRGGPRRYRTLSRFGTRDKVPRKRRQLAIAELLGALIKQRGLTDECRQHVVCLYWDEIAGDVIAPDDASAVTAPIPFTKAVSAGDGAVTSK